MACTSGWPPCSRRPRRRNRAGPDPAAGLDPEQRARLHREALRWAVVALDPVAADRAELGALDILRGWLDAPGARLPGSTAPGVVGDCLRAAASGDLRAALDAGVAAAVEAARRDPARRRAGTVVDPHRAADLARLAQLFTARQIRAGREPLPTRPAEPAAAQRPRRARRGNGRPQSRRCRWGCGGRARCLGTTGRTRAAWLTRCANCDAPLRLQGPLEWVYRDDDRFAESEDGYAGYLAGTCAACAAAPAGRGPARPDDQPGQRLRGTHLARRGGDVRRREGLAAVLVGIVVRRPRRRARLRRRPPPDVLTAVTHAAVGVAVAAFGVATSSAGRSGSPPRCPASPSRWPSPGSRSAAPLGITAGVARRGRAVRRRGRLRERELQPVRATPCSGTASRPRHWALTTSAPTRPCSA